MHGMLSSADDDDDDCQGISTSLWSASDTEAKGGHKEGGGRELKKKSSFKGWLRWMQSLVVACRGTVRISISLGFLVLCSALVHARSVMVCHEEEMASRGEGRGAGHTPGIL